MGLKLSEMNFQGNHLHFGVDGFIKDGKYAPYIDISKEKIITPKSDRSKFRPNIRDINANHHDIAISIHKGFINDMLDKSFRRKYFSNMLVGEDNTLVDLVAAPFVFTKKDPASGKTELRLKINTRYTVSGAKSIFVRNPIQVSFDIILDLTSEDDGKLNLTVGRLDSNSVHIPSKFIRAFSSQVRSSAKEIIRDMNKDLEGYVLSDSLPIPNNIFGIPLEYNFYKIDRKGNVILYIDTDI